MEKIKVVITDDHELILAGIEKLLCNTNEIELQGCFSNAGDLIAMIPDLCPDVILMDIDMPGMNGLQAAEIINTTYPDIKIIALTVHSEPIMVKKAKATGMKGFLLKNVGQDELIESIQRVYKGKNVYSADLTEQFILEDKPETSNLKANLTDRELEIICLIASGMSNTQIASKLNISARTVDTHRTNLMKKIGANNVASIVRFAITNQLV